MNDDWLTKFDDVKSQYDNYIFDDRIEKEIQDKLKEAFKQLPVDEDGNVIEDFGDPIPNRTVINVEEEAKKYEQEQQKKKNHQIKIIQKLTELQVRIISSNHPDKKEDHARIAWISYTLGAEDRILSEDERTELNELNKKYK